MSTSALPPIRVPRKLREMLRDYPEYVERLQDLLNQYIENPLPFRAYDGAVDVLLDDVSTLGSEGRRVIQGFAVELQGRIYYGMIGQAFLPDRNNFNIEVASFGWLSKECIGEVPEPQRCGAFTTAQLGSV